MTIKKEDGSWDIVKVATVIVAIPTCLGMLVTAVNLWQLPAKVDIMDKKIDALTEQENKNTMDIHTLKVVFHLDGGYAMRTNAMHVVNQSSTRDN